MITIKCRFKSNGETIKKKVIISDNLLTLSKSKLNDATSIVDEYWFNYETWGIIIEDTHCLYELHFKVKDTDRTLIPVKAVTWVGAERGLVVDVQELYISSN